MLLLQAVCVSTCDACGLKTQVWWKNVEEFSHGHFTTPGRSFWNPKYPQATSQDLLTSQDIDLFWLVQVLRQCQRLFEGSSMVHQEICPGTMLNHVLDMGCSLDMTPGNFRKDSVVQQSVDA